MPLLLLSSGSVPPPSATGSHRQHQRRVVTSFQPVWLYVLFRVSLAQLSNHSMRRLDREDHSGLGMRGGVSPAAPLCGGRRVPTARHCRQPGRPPFNSCVGLWLPAGSLPACVLRTDPRARPRGERKADALPPTSAHPYRATHIQCRHCRPRLTRRATTAIPQAHTAKKKNKKRSKPPPHHSAQAPLTPRCFSAPHRGREARPKVTKTLSAGNTPRSRSYEWGGDGRQRGRRRLPAGHAPRQKPHLAVAAYGRKVAASTCARAVEVSSRLCRCRKSQPAETETRISRVESRNPPSPQSPTCNPRDKAPPRPSSPSPHPNLPAAAHPKRCAVRSPPPTLPSSLPQSLVQGVTGS